MRTLALVVLAACQLPRTAPAGALCAKSDPTDQEVTDCVVNTLNEALGCTEFTEQGVGKLLNVRTQAFVEVVYQNEVIANIAAGLTTIDEGQKRTWRVTVQRQIAGWDTAFVLMHELGHTMALHFSDNTSDPMHSTKEADIMFHENDFGYLTASNVAAFITEAESATSPASAEWMCAGPLSLPPVVVTQ